MADPGRYLSRDIRAGKIILRIVGRDVFTVSGDVAKGTKASRFSVPTRTKAMVAKRNFFMESSVSPIHYSTESIDVNLTLIYSIER
jgi:hypothetical protein